MKTNLSKAVRRLNSVFRQGFVGAKPPPQTLTQAIAMARFSEVFRCSGVDESPNVPQKSKIPGMVIPNGGSNIVALEDGESLRVHSENKHIRIEEIGDTAVIKLARLSFRVSTISALLASQLGAYFTQQCRRYRSAWKIKLPLSEFNQ